MAQIRLVAEAADAGAGAGIEGDAAEDGGAGAAGQKRGSLREPVGLGVVVFRLELAADEQPTDPGADGGEDAAAIPSQYRGEVVELICATMFLLITVCPFDAQTFEAS